MAKKASTKLKVCDVNPSKRQLFASADCLMNSAPNATDLVLNRASAVTATGDYPRLVMTTSLAFQFDYDSTALYRFIINSKTGKYITALRPEFNQREVTFVQGLSGKFKLIGYQPLNGGEAARLAGGPGPFGVF